jgi:putative transposase
MIATLSKVIKRMHYPLSVMLTCVRWYVAYPLSLRHLEEMMAERGICVDHSSVHRGAIKIVPVLAAVFRRRQRPVGKSGRMDESYIKVRGQWKYLYRAVDRDGDTIDFITASQARLRGGAAFPGTGHGIARGTGQDHHRQERCEHGGDRGLQRRA